ncbi:Gfo/Idh/MocA family protein [Actomonas aquatica]|uniref:Gfo/Idh/MocA family oxidoreductase n=1 Tax=Actomonas aquatica TaxID=2866162 RepID=A0ABZ1C979_9BACT|nr:Gfo/Idh/MocA family oxidoreductase [Opitutus sp. WL0086]WRQ88256.1 Gfo/Idh/MocA family oxidoreductase [Opitutus sp. WL0086]
MKPLGLGVLGLGEGRSIISGGLQSDLWQVVRLCDLNEQLGHERCHEFGLDAAVFTNSMDVLLADPAVDVVGIYTPDHLHADHVIRALQAGKHVICTKPFIDNLTRAAEVVAAVQASGKRVMVGQSSRFFPPFARQRKHYETGAFGELNSVEAYYNADHRWFLAKGWAKTDAFKWLYGGLSHPVDFIRWYLPNIEEVMGYSRLSENGAKLGLVHADTFHFIYKTTDGKIARVSGTYTSPVTPNARDANMSCVLRGSLGASQGDYYDLRYAWKTDEQSVIETFEDKDDYVFRFGGHSHHAGEYQDYIEYFARCLANDEMPTPDVREGIVTVALMQAMEEAAASGGPVKVRELLARYGLEELF